MRRYDHALADPAARNPGAAVLTFARYGRRARPHMKESVMPASEYGTSTTAAEVIRDMDMHGRRVPVAGASSGIRVETARPLASAGAAVTMAVRNVEAGAKVATAITQMADYRAAVANLPANSATPRNSWFRFSILRADVAWG
jgi:hypothetical protein